MNSISIGFAVLAGFALLGFILTFKYKDELDDEGIFILLFMTTVSFIGFAVVSMSSWKSNEEFYKDCIDKTHNVGYCSKYLKE